MPNGPKGQKRPADVIGNAVHVMRISSAMAAGISKTLWEMKDLAGMVEAAAPKPGKRGPYRKQAA